MGAIALFHWGSCLLERWRLPMPGQRFEVAGTRLHLWGQGQKQDQRQGQKQDQRQDQRQELPGEAGDHSGPTIVLDHSLGGVEGYLLMERLVEKFGPRGGQVWVGDRAGYGWSDPSWQPRHSEQVVAELAEALEKAGVPQPYLLVGDSFGSYNMRLFAHRFPERVAGLVLTDGLHEADMLTLPWDMGVLKGFLGLSFGIAAIGAGLGIVRLCGTVGLFEFLKPELRQFSPQARARAKRSFYRAKHWWTMMREIWGLDPSGRQLRAVQDLGDLPIVSIKAATFLAPRIGPLRLPLVSADRVRDRMHDRLMGLSSRVETLAAPESGHFVWTDQPEVMIRAIEQVIALQSR